MQSHKVLSILIDALFRFVLFLFLDYFRSDEFSSSSFLSYCTNINAISSSCRRRSLSGAVITILMLSSDKNPWFGFLMKKCIHYVTYHFEDSFWKNATKKSDIDRIITTCKDQYIYFHMLSLLKIICKMDIHPPQCY